MKDGNKSGPVGADSPGLVEEPGLDVENVDALLDLVYQRYGYDFRDYARASLLRRIRGILDSQRLSAVSQLQERILVDTTCFDAFVGALTVNLSSLFRDPSFFQAVRGKVIPFLRTYPSIRIWCVGCAGGEEVYSMAILLEEAGLYRRCRIYATDLNAQVLQSAKDGLFPLATMQEGSKNYFAAGGERSLSEYYTASYDNAVFHPSLKANLVFALHNLATDSVFNEFQLVLCRKVLIYFNRALTERVHRLLHESLCRLGVLGLGAKESLRQDPLMNAYEQLDSHERLYKKVR